jgi:hypothetical protein
VLGSADGRRRLGCQLSPSVAARTGAPRHGTIVRWTHWITALSFLALLVSVMEIVVSHPRFYRGENGNVLTHDGHRQTETVPRQLRVVRGHPRA